MMALQATERARDLEAYQADLRAAGLDAPWAEPGPLIRPKASAVQARLWRWADIEPLVRPSAEFMTLGRGAERRVLRLDNPGVPERTSTHTISTAVQYILPGEVAPAHRYTPNAVRFILHGHGAYTTVEGDKCVMEPGDLVLTPTMTWHDHGNEGRAPVMWIDGLDSPVLRYLENLAMDTYPEERQPVAAVSAWPPRACDGHADGRGGPAILLSFQDVPLLTALGLYRTEAGGALRRSGRIPARPRERRTPCRPSSRRPPTAPPSPPRCSRNTARSSATGGAGVPRTRSGLSTSSCPM